MTSGRPPFDEWQMHALILVERITGVRLTAEWLSREQLCTAGGLAWVRKTDRLKFVVKVGESHPGFFGEAEELWSMILAGKAK